MCAAWPVQYIMGVLRRPDLAGSGRAESGRRCFEPPPEPEDVDFARSTTFQDVPIITMGSTVCSARQGGKSYTGRPRRVWVAGYRVKPGGSVETGLPGTQLVCEAVRQLRGDGGGVRWRSRSRFGETARRPSSTRMPPCCCRWMERGSAMNDMNVSGFANSSRSHRVERRRKALSKAKCAWQKWARAAPPISRRDVLPWGRGSHAWERSQEKARCIRLPWCTSEKQGFKGVLPKRWRSEMDEARHVECHAAGSKDTSGLASA